MDIFIRCSRYVQIDRRLEDYSFSKVDHTMLPKTFRLSSSKSLRNSQADISRPCLQGCRNHYTIEDTVYRRNTFSLRKKLPFPSIAQVPISSNAKPLYDMKQLTRIPKTRTTSLLARITFLGEPSFPTSSCNAFRDRDSVSPNHLKRRCTLRRWLRSRMSSNRNRLAITKAVFVH